MATPITGDATAATNSLARTVTGATNATPIVITTSVPHLFATGDSVVVASVGGNTAANGTWTISVLSSTTFELDTSVGSGAYTSGGAATDVSLTPQFNIPSGSDLKSVASVNVAFEALADRTQFLNGLVASTETSILAIIAALQTSVDGMSFYVDEYTTNGTWVSPITGYVVVEALGGGGGGGGGRNGAVSGTTSSPSGAGGGGAQASLTVVAVTAGASYAVSIASGGAGGAVATDGLNGGSTSFGGNVVAPGARGGCGGTAAASATNVRNTGGSATRATGAEPGEFYTYGTVPIIFSPGCGGAGGNAYAGVATSTGGAYSLAGYAGGVLGAAGTLGTAAGGGGGGGGGGGARGAGGAGGAGGNGGTNGTAGTAGTAGGANTGGGGGGGGAGGSGTSSAGNGAAGGAGGSGYLRVIYPKAA